MNEETPPEGEERISDWVIVAGNTVFAIGIMIAFGILKSFGVPANMYGWVVSGIGFLISLAVVIKNATLPD